MSKIKLKVLRPMMLHGQMLDTDYEFNVEAHAAPALLESGRCGLVNESDKAVIATATREQVAALLRAQRTLGAHPGDPWHSVH